MFLCKQITHILVISAENLSTVPLTLNGKCLPHLCDSQATRWQWHAAHTRDGLKLDTSKRPVRSKMKWGKNNRFDSFSETTSLSPGLRRVVKSRVYEGSYNRSVQKQETARVCVRGTHKFKWRICKHTHVYCKHLKYESAVSYTHLTLPTKLSV